MDVVPFGTELIFECQFSKLFSWKIGISMVVVCEGTKSEYIKAKISILTKTGCSTFWKRAPHISFELWQLCHAVVYLLHCRVAVQNLKRHVYAKVRAYFRKELHVARPYLDLLTHANLRA